VNAKELEAWRARPMEVRVLELCGHCDTLKEGVAKHEHKSYWPSYQVSMTSCPACFELAKSKARDEANGKLAGVVCA
jgi:hypothetical protein